MPVWKLNLFVRVVKNRLATEGLTADEILATYPALTSEEVTEIKANL